MTRRIGSVVVIEPEPVCPCARCGVRNECRDVLGDGSRICFACATPAEREAYGQRLFGEKGSSRS